MKKININRLDKSTKATIKKYQKRYKQLVAGETMSVNLPIDIYYFWFKGNKCTVAPWGENLREEIDWNFVKKQTKLVQQQVNKEIKEICDFVDKVAEKLGHTHSDVFECLFITDEDF